MFRKRHKHTIAPLVAFNSWRERKEQKFLSFLQRRTLHWNKRKKATMLVLIILLFGGFYTLLLISVIRHENKQAYYFKQEHIKQMNSLFNPRLKQLDKKEKSIKPP